jgi:hypothetical protein
MKRYIKKFGIVFMTVLCIGCTNNSEDDLKYGAQVETGWVQFVPNSPAVINASIDNPRIIQIGVDIQVPVTTQDLVVTYDLVPVSGLDPNTVFSNNGQVTSPAGETGYAGPDNGTSSEYVYLPTIDIDVSEINVNLSEVMVFDVILRSTNISGVTVGLAGETFPTVQRVQICPSLTSTSGAFTGDYILSLIAETSPFGVQFLDGITVTLSEGPDGPFSRTFEADYLPGIAAGPPVIPITFSFVDGNIVVADGIVTGLACGGGTQPVFLGNDLDNVLPSPCGDASIRLNFLDFLGGACGQSDIPFSLVLTKI